MLVPQCAFDFLKIQCNLYIVLLEETRMTSKQNSAVDTFLIDSILFIAPTEVDGESCRVFQFEDGTQSYYATPTEGEQVAMTENIRSSLGGSTTFICYFESYVNTEHLTSAEVNIGTDADSRLVFLFKNGITFTQTYTDADLLRLHHAKFHVEWEKLKNNFPPAGSNRVLH